MKEPNNYLIFEPNPVVLDKYIENKILILEELGIKLDWNERKTIENLKSETAVDRYARSLIMDRLGEE